nr:unnamed protein product [Callosobruchus chinensis]CAH7753972.1 unnamed protein product [Callosobruchus chinensis]
MQSPDKT